MTGAMQQFTLGWMAEQLDDELAAYVVGDASVSLGAVSTDSRSIKPGQLFVALKGPNHDAHAYIEAVSQAGASALVVDHETPATKPQLVVKDTRLALGQMAKVWCRHHAVERIAITGSNGKTTVKEMVASILRHAVLRKRSNTLKSTIDASDYVLATAGNLNNDIGLPLTCLSIQPGHSFAVLEMGTSGVGEIAYLSRIAEPVVALVNNIAPAHLEGFGTLEAIAHEKASIFSGLSERGVAVFPEGSPFESVFRDAASHCDVLTFGQSEAADVRTVLTDKAVMVEIGSTVDTPLAGNRFEFSLQLAGQHNQINALAAVAVCCKLDVTVADIVDGLAAVAPVPGRLQIRDETAARLIDDTYNANPGSLKAAIDLLAGYSGQKVLVLGDMKELGDEELELHAVAGRYAKNAGIDVLMSVGTLAAHAAVGFGENAVSCTTKESLAEALLPYAADGHTLLFKGSRGARMEEVISLLTELASRGNTVSDTDTDADQGPERQSAAGDMSLHGQHGVGNQVVFQ